MKAYEVPRLEEIYLGQIVGFWPIQAFANVNQALDWVTRNPPRETRKIWKVKLSDITEMTLVHERPRLVEKEKVDDNSKSTCL